MLLKQELDFYSVIGEVLFVGYLKQNYRYENGVKTDEIESFSIKCFSLNQLDVFILKITDMEFLPTVMELDLFTRLDIRNGKISIFKGNYYFKSAGFKVIEND